jgi:hypothetical protein
MNSAINGAHRDTVNPRDLEPLADGGDGATPDESLRALTLSLVILFTLSTLLWATVIYLGLD